MKNTSSLRRPLSKDEVIRILEAKLDTLGDNSLEIKMVKDKFKVLEHPSPKVIQN